MMPISASFYDEGILKESLFGYIANLHPRVLAVKLCGPTKEQFVWGLSYRISYLRGNS